MQNPDIGNFETSSTLETFGFLPKMDAGEIQAQAGERMSDMQAEGGER